MKQAARDHHHVRVFTYVCAYACVRAGVLSIARDSHGKDDPHPVLPYVWYSSVGQLDSIAAIRLQSIIFRWRLFVCLLSVTLTCHHVIKLKKQQGKNNNIPIPLLIRDDEIHWWTSYCSRHLTTYSFWCTCVMMAGYFLLFVHGAKTESPTLNWHAKHQSETVLHTTNQDEEVLISHVCAHALLHTM